MAKNVGREEWLQDVANRQRNIVFPDTAANEARFWRNIVAGKQRLTGLQAAGIALVGLALIVMLIAYFVASWPRDEATVSTKLVQTFGGPLLVTSVVAAFLWLLGRSIRRRFSSRL